jgi:peptidoglycan biosynthesis protein MviN/MurJ (putative lipid II flippase)
VAKPERLPDPEPLETNDVLAVAVGTAAWVIALVVLLLLHGTLERHHTTWWYWVCGIGIALGCAGLFVTSRRRRRRAGSG